MTTTAARQAFAWKVRQGALTWSRDPIPQPEPGSALVAVAYAGLCGSDIAKLATSPVQPPDHDWQPGHEIVGWHASGGSRRMVVVDPLIGCGDCGHCRARAVQLCPRLQRVGWDVPGGFAEFVVVPQRSLLPLPPGAEPAHAVLADPLAVAIHGLRCAAQSPPPGQLCIVGSGTVAICTAAYASSLGWEVTLIARQPAKLAPLRGLLPALLAPPGAPCRDFDVVVDAAGGRDDASLNTALNLVRDGGTVVVQTAYDPGVRLNRDLRPTFRRSLTIAGAFSYCHRDGRGDFATALDILAERPGWADPLTGTRFALDDLPEALASVTGRRAHRPIKAVLTSEGPRL